MRPRTLRAARCVSQKWPSGCSRPRSTLVTFESKRTFIRAGHRTGFMSVQFLRDASTCAERAGVFTRPRPTADQDIHEMSANFHHLGRPHHDRLTRDAETPPAPVTKIARQPIAVSEISENSH